MANAGSDCELDRPTSQKAPDAFRTISEVSMDLDIPQHVLRFWEGKFTQIKPLKRGGGRRYYRPEDVDLLRGIQNLLYGDGYTIKGVQKLLREHGVKFVVAAGRKHLEHQQARTKPAPRLQVRPPEAVPASPVAASVVSEAEIAASASHRVSAEASATDRDAAAAGAISGPTAERLAAAAQVLSRLKAMRRDYDLRLQAAKNGRRAA